MIGAGASAMAFVDELIHNSKELTVVMMDKRAKPGGSLWEKMYIALSSVSLSDQVDLSGKRLKMCVTLSSVSLRNQC